MALVNDIPQASREAIQEALAALVEPIARELMNDQAIVDYLRLRAAWAKSSKDVGAISEEYHAANNKLRAMRDDLRRPLLAQLRQAEQHFDKAHAAWKELQDFRDAGRQFSQRLMHVGIQHQRRLRADLEVTHQELLRELDEKPSEVVRQKIAAVRGLYRLLTVADMVGSAVETSLLAMPVPDAPAVETNTVESGAA